MLVKFIATMLVSLCLASAWAQPNCVEETQCRSQLIRVEVANSIFQNSGQSLLPALRTFSESPTLSSMIEREFPLQPVQFPHYKETCDREKRLNPLFASINCEDPGLCGRELDPTVRGLICFRLPCPIFEGTLNTGACGTEQNIYPNQLSFPTPLKIDRIRLEPTSVQFEGNRARLCFKINELALNMSVRLGLDTRGTQLRDSGVNVTNIAPTLDGPREVCMNANVDVNSPTPVSNFTLEPQGNTPFISDEMIRTASRGIALSGLSGYPEGDLQRVSAEIIPVIFQPLRESVETALKTSLSTVFQTEINRLAGQATATGSHLVSSTNLSSEIGLGNLRIRNQVAITECAAIKAAQETIPRNHPCVGLPWFDGPITPENFGSPLINELMELKRLASREQITSESIKQRLIALKDLVRRQVDEFARPDDPPHFVRARLAAVESSITEFIDPVIDQISRNQLEGEIFNFVEIQNQLQNGASRNVGVSVPEICSDTNPSPHARREMRNCPVQAYVDLNEMNQVMRRMWEAGRVCQRGRGAYVPERDEFNQQKYDEEGKPIGSGCYFEVGGMGCYMNNPPQITYDARTRKYKTAMNLKACYRGPVAFGIGRLGGDFNIDFSFTPKACNGGDFCMDNPDVQWKVVPGSERFALRPTSLLNDIVNETIQSQINGAIGDTIRIPMTSNVGPLASIPLEAEGRVDTGPGFFGACLRLRGSGASGQ